jgi:hypothetical protein
MLKPWHFPTECYAVLIGGHSPTLRDNISVPFSRVQLFFFFERMALEGGTGRHSRNVGA